MPTLTYNAGSGDCYGNTSGAFAGTSTIIEIGNASASNYPLKAWIPFASVAIPQGTTISSATFKVVASSSLSGTTVKVKVGCEATDSATSAPTNWTTLNAKTLTTAYTTNNNVASWTAGTTYTFDITTAVQEIINRAGFASGNTIAVLIHDNGSTNNITRAFASDEHATYAAAILEIVYTAGSQFILWS